MVKKYYIILTLDGSIYCIIIANSLPQAAPVNKFGMNSPLDTERPNVQDDSRK